MGIDLNSLPPKHRAAAMEQLRADVAARPAGEAALKNPAGGPQGSVAASASACWPVTSHEPNPILTAFFKENGIPIPVAEFVFHPDRKWRFDFAWSNEKVALEVQGGIFEQGRHTRGAALLKEWQKLNAAAILGWRILYCQPKDILKHEIATMILAALALEASGQPVGQPAGETL
jgi:hypothetical protein